MRTSYSVLGARKMHVMRDRSEIAERHGADRVARCTARATHGRPGAARRPPRQVLSCTVLGWLVFQGGVFRWNGGGGVVVVGH